MPPTELVGADAVTDVRRCQTLCAAPDNTNVVDPRNWTGLGHRSIDNMAIVIMPTIVLSDEEFAEEMATRREQLGLAEGEGMLGCPLCGFVELPGGRDR